MGVIPLVCDAMAVWVCKSYGNYGRGFISLGGLRFGKDIGVLVW